MSGDKNVKMYRPNFDNVFMDHKAYADFYEAGGRFEHAVHLERGVSCTGLVWIDSKGAQYE